jgi:hypothetical protein
MPLADGFAPTAVALQDPLILHGPTKLRSWVDCSTSCCDAFCVSVAPRVVPCAASAAPAVLLVISPLPCAASFTLA